MVLTEEELEFGMEHSMLKYPGGRVWVPVEEEPVMISRVPGRRDFAGTFEDWLINLVALLKVGLAPVPGE